jgi:hypothetical protein
MLLVTSTSMEAVMSGRGKVLLVLALLIATPVAGVAQSADPSTPPAQSQSVPPPPAQPEPSQPLLKPEQLDALAAPIALYPDELLANVLAASTYPLEIVQADRWVSGHKSLKGDALKKEVDKQAWDDSVKALAAMPEVLAMMSDKLDWTKGLGDAVLAQQPDVMEAIQRLRSKAETNKKLTTTKQQKVSIRQEQNKQVIVIEPTVPDTMYVPYYDPAVVYGAWPYSEYPPYYFAAPAYIGAGVVAAGIAFGAGFAIARWGNYWGGGCNWGNNNFFINRSNNIGNNWQHNPAHRQGVRYNNANVAQRFGNNNLKAGAADRMDHRGRDGAGDRGGDRAGTRDKPAGDRAGAGGDRGNRPSTADRSKGGDRAKSGGDRAKGGGDRAKSANRGGGPAAAKRGGGDSALGNISSGRAANVQSTRGQASLGGRGGGPVGGGGFAGRGGGGGGFSGGGGGFRGGGGGRRSDLALKHDIVLLGHLDNGLGYYRFSYLGSSKAYVGVIAQEVKGLVPEAVTRGGDGYLRVFYEKLGLKLRTYRDWFAAGAQIPSRSRI